jgi:hypothetical protein
VKFRNSSDFQKKELPVRLVSFAGCIALKKVQVRRATLSMPGERGK